MTAPTGDPVRKPLRLWPGVVAAVLLVLVRFGATLVDPSGAANAVFGGLIGAALILLWWLFLSRARWSERLGVVVVMAAALLATWRILDVSIATGAMGMLFPIMAIPGVMVALVIGLVVTRGRSDVARRATVAVLIVAASGVWALIRTGGFTANLHNDFAWRWSPTPEERLLARADETGVTRIEPAAPAAAPMAPPEWPGFRGPERDSIARGTRIETDWTKSPPVVLWRRPIGPGWSSFAVQGNLIYTQEQRGDEEIVACYDATTGKPVWMHADAARFWESNGGAGPRGTPTLSNGRVYTFGATGILNALDAGTGAVIWTRNAAADTGAKLPGWGFSSSPLVLDDIVIVATAGQLAGFDLATGKPRWIGPPGGGGYSSPQLMTIDGVPQVVLMSGTGATSVAPGDGEVLWRHPWEGMPIVQPARTDDGGVLITTTSSGTGADGIRRLKVMHAAADAAHDRPGAWTASELWMSSGLKPYFNDFVIHKGHAYGFDGSILACIDLENGKRVWKGGRYGNGQLILLADQDVLLVTAEEGELALVSATPDEFREIARVPALEGKTWNHPVLVRDLLLVRNGEEMVAFRLVRQGR